MNKDNKNQLTELMLLKEGQVETYFGLRTRTLQDWRLKGGGPKFVKAGRSVYYRIQDIIAFLDARTYSNTGEAALAA